MKSDLPIACSLTPDQFDESRDLLLPSLLSDATGQDAVPGGFRWRFEPKEGLLVRIASVLEVEQRCCAFLEFELRSGANAPVYLQVTGPPGTDEFLLDLLERGTSRTSSQ